jgi:hypothetical protein
LEKIIMKFICLGCVAEKDWEAISKSEQEALIETCFAYDDELRRHGHWLDAGQALQGTRTAKTLRWKNGKVVVINGPFAETKEQLGGIGVLEARDMDHAVELLSKHPGLRISCFEIRPTANAAVERKLPSGVDTEYRSGAASGSNTKAETMNFACLGYVATEDWDAMSKSDRDTMIEECRAFDEIRRKHGQWVGGTALESAATAKTVRSKGARVIVTDGPYAETKEQLGGVVIIRVKDMNHAVDLISTHPALRFGVTIEIRPTDEEMNARWAARQD